MADRGNEQVFCPFVPEIGMNHGYLLACKPTFICLLGKSEVRGVSSTGFVLVMLMIKAAWSGVRVPRLDTENPTQQPARGKAYSVSLANRRRHIDY
jgi:hypothetical protein